MGRFIAEIALIIGAYLIGSFPYLLILSRTKGVNIAYSEDFHISVWRKVGRLEGFSGIVFDILKGVLPVLIGFICDFRLVIIAIAGVAAVIGQMWPVFQKFNGGKGNTTGGGMALTLTLFLGNGALLALCSGIIFFALGFGIKTISRLTNKSQTLKEVLEFRGPVSNSLPVGMLAGFFVIPLASWLLNQPLEMTLALTGVFVAIAIRRLTANLGRDLKSPKTSIGRILLNRFLFDRSYF